VSNTISTTASNNKRVRTVTLRDDEELESLSKEPKHSTAAEKPRTGNYSLNDRIYEIVTQALYIVLFLLYIAQVFEFSIVCSTSSVNKSIVQELCTVVLTFVVHIYHYGIAYGHDLWLSSVAAPESLTPSHRSSSYRNNANRRRHRQFIIGLHCFAFVYFIVISFCTTTKLILIGLIWGRQFNVLASVLRPYILLLSVLVQTYFVIFHFVNIISLVSQPFHQ